MLDLSTQFQKNQINSYWPNATEEISDESNHSSTEFNPETSETSSVFNPETSETTLHNCQCLNNCSMKSYLLTKQDTCIVDSNCEGAFYNQGFKKRDCCIFNQIDQQENKTAIQKLEYLMENILSNVRKGKYPSKSKKYYKSVVTSQINNRDEMPNGRLKTINSIGQHAKIEFIPSDNYHFDRDDHYTGIFNEISTGIIRLSTTEPFESDKFKPAVSLKFLRDKQTSCNILFMARIYEGQKRNFFVQDQSNHVVPPNNIENKMLTQKYKEATQCRYCVGLQTCAAQNNKGQSQSTPHFPFMLNLRPIVKVENAFVIENINQLENSLFNLNNDTALFEVQAQNDPLKVIQNQSEDSEQFGIAGKQIGYIKLKSKFTQSNYGDNKLFFKHNFMEDDISQYPHWKIFMQNHKNNKEISCGKQCSKNKREQTC